MNKNIKFVLLTIAFFLGGVVTFLFEGTLVSILYSDGFSPFLKKWETLISGGMAVAAAIVSICVMNKNHRENSQAAEEQHDTALKAAEERNNKNLEAAEERQNKNLEASEERHNDVVRRKALSLRAHLPDILSSLSEYCKACFEYITKSARDKKYPEYDKKNMDILKECIAYDVSNELYDLVNFFQVHNSRLKGYSGEEPIFRKEAGNKESVYYDVVKLNAQILNVFEYARGKEDKIKPFCENSEDMGNSLRSLGGNKDQVLYGDVLSLINKRLKK